MDGTASPAPPRVLAVADRWPWPAGPARSVAILDGLAAAGEVDLCVVVPSPGPPPAEAAAVLRRCFRTHVIVAVGGAGRIDDLIDGGHEQIWYLTPRALRLVGRRPAARCVVDLGGGAHRPARAEMRRVRRDADLVLTRPDGPVAPDPAVAVLLPDGDALPRTVTALARTGAVPPARHLAGLDLRAEGLVA